MEYRHDLQRWDKFFVDQVRLVASLSTCPARSVGAIIIRDKRMIATGFNGPPAGHPHPDRCIRRERGIPSGQGLDLCPCIHAEANAIANAARAGATTVGASVWCTTLPCAQCMGLIVNAGLRSVHYLDGYPSGMTEQIAKWAGIELRQIKLNGE